MNLGLIVHCRITYLSGYNVAIMEDEYSIWVDINPPCSTELRYNIEEYLHNEGYFDFLDNE